MKPILLGFFSLFIFLSAAIAQTPQYFVNATSGNNSYPFNTTTGNKVQWLLLNSDFTSVPSGTITKIYFKAASSATNATYTNFTIKMGMTTITAFSSSTYITAGMSTVVSGSPYVVASVTNGGWTEFALTMPFVYSNTNNIIVEVESSAYSNGFNVHQNSLTGRRIYGVYGNATGSGFDGQQIAFGFDIQTCPNPILSAQPAHKNLCEGVSTSFSVAATNAGSYQWQVNPGSGWSNISNSSVHSGATTNTLSLSTIDMTMNNNLYRCVVTGNCNNPKNSDSAVLHVLPGATVVSHTLSDTTCSGTSISLDVNAVGTVAGYQWEMAMPTVGVYYPVPNQPPFSGINAAILDITNVPDTLDGYVFKCTVSGGSCPDDITAAIPLKVLPPPSIANSPENVTVQLGSGAVFSIISVGDVTYYWQASTDGINFSNINNGPLYQDVTTPALTVKSVSLAQAGWWFRCIIKSNDPACGSFRDTSDAAQLKVHWPAGINDITAGDIINVYPNPVSGSEIFIQSNIDIHRKLQITIIDKLGRAVYNGGVDLSGNKKVSIPVVNLAPGMYYLQAVSANGEIHTLVRFVKQ